MRRNRRGCPGRAGRPGWLRGQPDPAAAVPRRAAGGHAPPGRRRLLPERAGQPVKIWAHISLADLLPLEGSSALQEEWTALVRARWAGHRAAASQGGGDSGAWLDGDAAEAIACDAAMAPVVTGDVNLAALEDLVRLCTELGKLRHGSGDADAGTGDERGAPGPDTGLAWEALEQAIIGKTTNFLLHSILPSELQ